MSTVRNSVHPGQITEEKVIHILREHMDDADAATLARRYLAADQTKRAPFDISAMKRRLLKLKIEQ